MRQSSGTSTVEIERMPTAATFKIFSPPQGIGPRILQLIATETGTEKCPRRPGKWDEHAGGSCSVFPYKLRRKQIVTFQLVITRSQTAGLSAELLGESGFFLQEQIREQEEGKMTMRFEGQIILIGIDLNAQSEHEYPMKVIRVLANRVVGQIIHECINSLISDGSLSKYRHPSEKPEKKDSRAHCRFPSGFTRLTPAHRTNIQFAGDRHILRPPLKRTFVNSPVTRRV